MWYSSAHDDDILSVYMIQALIEVAKLKIAKPRADPLPTARDQRRGTGSTGLAGNDLEAVMVSPTVAQVVRLDLNKASTPDNFFSRNHARMMPQQGKNFALSSSQHSQIEMLKSVAGPGELKVSNGDGHPSQQGMTAVRLAKKQAYEAALKGKSTLP